MIKNPPAMQEMQEMQVPSLGLEDLLQEEMATYSSILAWRNPMDVGVGHKDLVTKQQQQ